MKTFTQHPPLVCPSQPASMNAHCMQHAQTLSTTGHTFLGLFFLYYYPAELAIQNVFFLFMLIEPTVELSDTERAS